MTRRQMLVFCALLASFVGPAITFAMLDWDWATSTYMAVWISGVVVFQRAISDWIWPPKPQPVLDIDTLLFVIGVLGDLQDDKQFHGETVRLLNARLKQVVVTIRDGRDPRTPTIVQGGTEKP